MLSWSKPILFIHSGHFYSASSSPLLLRGTVNTARILCRSFTPKHHRQLRVKDLPKVPTWRLERDSNPRPFGRKVTNLPMSHHAPHIYIYIHSLPFQSLCLDTCGCTQRNNDTETNRENETEWSRHIHHHHHHFHRLPFTCLSTVPTA